MDISQYTPRRVAECYSDKDGEIEIFSYKATEKLRLKGLGRNIWYMLDGKHTIQAIAEKLCTELSINDYDAIFKELVIILNTLVKRKTIIANWNSLYKMQLSQELNYSE